MPDPAAVNGPRRLRRTPPGWSENVPGDIAGGIIAALISVPLSIGFGILAFAPLGEGAAALGIVAGLVGAVFLGLVAIVSGARSVAIFAPRSLVAFMIGSVALHTIAGSDAAVLQDATPVELAAALLFTLSLAGLIQIGFGIAGFGALMKFIPSPVMAGFQNAAAILILWSQVNVLLGVPGRPVLAELPRALERMLPLNLAVGVFAALLMIFGARLTRRVPPAVLGLLAGTFAYYLCLSAGFGHALGPAIGALPVTLPDGRFPGQIIALAALPGFAELLPALFAAALSVAIVASLDFLVSTKIVESMSGVRAEANRELQRVGLANLVTPLLGGMAGAVSLSATAANYRAGGRSALSQLVHCLVIMTLVVLLPPLFDRIPLVVVAGVVVATSAQLFDRWTVQLLRQVFMGRSSDWRRAALDLGVIGAVTAISVLGDIVVAVALGMGIAAVFFVLRMSRSVVRREYRGDAVHSRRTRSEPEMGVLAEHGRRIAVFELDGPLFFGSTEVLADRVDAAVRAGATHVVLDFRRVNEVDSTGARLLLLLHDRLRGGGRHLALTAADGPRRALAALGDAGVLAALTRRRLFPDVDRALEWAEDEVIAVAASEARDGGEFPLERMELLRDFGAAEIDLLRGALERREFAAGDELVREGEPGEELFILARGSASVYLRLPGESVSERLVTFSPGTIFGEIALLDSETRSATVVSDADSVCYVLSRRVFEGWVGERHPVALKLLTNLGRELGMRLRRANRMIAQMDA